MPLLIFHCRTRLFLVFVQQRTVPGGARTETFVDTAAGTVNDFHIVSHHAFSINPSDIIILKEILSKIVCKNFNIF